MRKLFCVGYRNDKPIVNTAEILDENEWGYIVKFSEEEKYITFIRKNRDWQLTRCRALEYHLAEQEVQLSMWNKRHETLISRCQLLREMIEKENG